jgi:protein transport protein SEC24
MPGGGATPVSSSFYQAPPNQGQRPAQPGGPGAAPGAPSQSQVFQENIDLSIKIPKRLFRFSSDKVAQTSAIASASKIPLGGVVRPLAPIPADEEQIATVQPGAAGIIRCKRCRTYINAFVHWVEHGRRWRCNICAQMNETPAAYFCHLDDQGLRRDRAERPELSKGVVEFIAPAEYMVRPPQEPSYFFVIDVSATAVRSGMLAHAANAIKSSLDELPGRTRTKVGFITFDNSVHYYNLGSDLAQPQMLVVSDLQELFVPLPDNLLVNLQESRDVVESFLDNLPDMFSKNPVVSRSCLGPALKAAFTVMKQIGGKMCVFQTIMPNTGDGSLKPRENPGLMGTPNEVQLLRPETQWYKDTAIEFSRQQISVDMFLFPYQYMDLAALGELPKLTSGSLHSYVSFNPEKDGQRFEEQLVKVLTQPTAFEAVMRIRCSKGMRITNFYGNFYIRGTDLMALPNVNADSVFGFDLSHDEQNVASNYVTVQAALLYTSSDGQRRIRVMTQALAVTSLTSDLIASVDPLATMNLLSKQAVDVSVKTTIDNARIRLQQSCVDILKAAKGGDKRTVSGYAVPKGSQPGEDEDKPLPDNLQLLPLYTLALMKNVAFRGGTDVHPDERIQAHHLINQMWVSASEHYIYPRLFSLHDMDQDAGYSLEETADVDSKDACAGHDRIALPRVVSLSIDGLTSNGIYLLDNGFSMFVWVGRSADQNLVNSLFGVPSLEDVDPALINLLTSGDDYSSRIGAIVEALREDDADPYVVSSQIQIIREGDGHTEARFFWFLVEDRASFQGGTYNYEEFMHFVQNAGGPGGAAPPGPGGPGPRGAPPGPQRGGPMPPGPSQQNYGAPPPQMGQSGPPAPAYNQGPPAPPSNQGPPAPAYNQGPPAPAYNQGPPAPAYNQGPPAPAYNQGPPAPAYNQGPPAPAYNQGPPAPAYNQPPGPSYSQGPPGGPPQHSQG